MTQKEVDAVARAVGFADNGCETCAKKVCTHLNGARLGHHFAVSKDQSWRDEIDEDDPDDPRGWGWLHIEAVADGKATR